MNNEGGCCENGLLPEEDTSPNIYVINQKDRMYRRAVYVKNENDEEELKEIHSREELSNSIGDWSSECNSDHSST